LVISIDAMGGDHGPSVTLPALSLLKESTARTTTFILHGDETLIGRHLAAAPDLAGRCAVRHTDSVIAMDAKPAAAMRRGRGASMWNAVDCVRTGEAAAAVSGGNSGALMAISRLLLRMVGELDRPALVANWPTSAGMTSVLDVGANIVCDTERLVEFAVMGAAYHSAIHQIPRPSVALLNVGTEHDKGNEEVKGADRWLRDGGFEFDYKGFVEGDDIAKGVVDVIVTDGFTGNVALKTAEGLARFFRAELRRTFTDSALSRLGGVLARRSLTAMGERLDPSNINGGPFLGLNGLVVKSHGSADARGFATAIQLAVDLARYDFTDAVRRNLAALISAPQPLRAAEQAL
jgi:glycerol-3-phosphate acyltransferase PlsX